MAIVDVRNIIHPSWRVLERGAPRSNPAATRAWYAALANVIRDVRVMSAESIERIARFAEAGPHKRGRPKRDPRKYGALIWTLITLPRKHCGTSTAEIVRMILRCEKLPDTEANVKATRQAIVRWRREDNLNIARMNEWNKTLP